MPKEEILKTLVANRHKWKYLPIRRGMANEAEDLLSEALLQFSERFNPKRGGKPEAAFYHYLSQAIADRKRQMQRAFAFEKDTIIFLPTTYDPMADMETKEVLEQCLLYITSKAKENWLWEAFYYHTVEEMSYQELAEKFQTSEGFLRKTFSILRTEMRDVMQKFR